MRHIGTLLAAAVIGPLAWILFALGQDRSARAFAAASDGGALDSADFVRPALVLGAAGILLGLIGTLRFSPLGAALTGVLYSASYLGLLISPSTTLRLFDHTLTLAGHQVDLAAPLRTGTTLLVGTLLLVAVVSVRRWRRWPQPADEAPTALAPDEVLPPPAGGARPLGADGLGLNPLSAKPEPELVTSGGTDRTRSWESAGGTDRAHTWDSAGGAGGAGRSEWSGLLPGDLGSRRPADWRQPPKGRGDR